MRQHVRNYYHSKIKKKTGEKPEAMKFVWPAVLLFFTVGIIAANIMNRQQADGYNIWSTYFIDKYKYSHIRSLELFYYILQDRFPVLMLLLLFAISDWGKVAGIIFMSWQGFTAGFLMAVAVIVYGIKGILLMGVAVFPQYLIYFPVYIACIYLSAFWRKRHKEGSELSKTAGKKEYILLLAICLVMAGVYITGIFLESYVNPYLLKKILKFF